MLGAELEWVRELLRYCTGRATLRAYESPAHYFEDDKDGVKVREYTRYMYIDDPLTATTRVYYGAHAHVCARMCIARMHCAG